MTETVSVRVTDGDVWVDGEHLTRGDEVEIPTTVYERISRSFEQVDDVDDVTDDADEEQVDQGDPPEVDPHPGELTVDEIEDRVAEVDDLAKLRAILSLEEDGKDRTTATDAIEERIHDLEE